jgi:hypothetical protein
MSDHTIETSIKNLNSSDLVRFKYYIFKDKFDINNVGKYQKSNTTHYGCFAINKNSFLELNGFEPWICAADGEFMWRCEANNYKIVGIESPGFYYRRHDTNLTIAGPTSMNSPLRKYYHNIKKNKIKEEKKEKLDILSIVDFLEISKYEILTYLDVFMKMKIQNPYNFENDYEISKNKKTKIIEKLIDPQPTKLTQEIVDPLLIHQHEKIQPTIEKKELTLNYDKINQIFNGGSRQVITRSSTSDPINVKPKTNSDVLKKLMNKPRRR